MKIFRAAICLGVLAYLLPSPPPEDSGQSAASPGKASAAPVVSANARALFAAGVGAVDVFSVFCTRQPMVCDTAHTLLLKLEAKAKYSLRLLYQWAETPEQHPAVSTEATL